jgi:WD40 repeat protein
MIRADKKWYIQDAKGGMYVMEYGQEDYSIVYRFNEGSIVDIVTSPTHNYSITLGESGCIKVWDYVRKEVAYTETFSGKGTCLEHVPFTEGNKGRVFAAGFDNGIVRIMSVTADGIVILKAFKAHEDAIAGIKYSDDLTMCVTASKTGDVFFFEIDALTDSQKYEPLCTIKLPDDAGVTDFKWNKDDKSVLFGCNTGYVY